MGLAFPNQLIQAALETFHQHHLALHPTCIPSEEGRTRFPWPVPVSHFPLPCVYASTGSPSSKCMSPQVSKPLLGEVTQSAVSFLFPYVNCSSATQIYMPSLCVLTPHSLNGYGRSGPFECLRFRCCLSRCSVPCGLLLVHICAYNQALATNSPSETNDC